MNFFVGLSHLSIWNFLLVFMSPAWQYLLLGSARSCGNAGSALLRCLIGYQPKVDSTETVSRYVSSRKEGRHQWVNITSCNIAARLSGCLAPWLSACALLLRLSCELFFGGGRSAASPSNAGSEEGPQPVDLVVAETPVTFHPPHPVEVVLAHEAGRPENESVAATAEAAQAAETMVVHMNDQRLQIAQSLKSSLNQEFQPNISMLNTDQLCRHACDLATAPGWMKECYNTQQNFTWAPAGFNVLLRSSEFSLPHWHEDPAVDAGSHG